MSLVEYNAKCSCAPSSFAFSIIMVTFARDHILQRSVDQLVRVVGSRADVEFILVDNNPDTIDRRFVISGFNSSKYVKTGRNIGVSARNTGAAVSEGEYILFVDDDDLLYPADALAIYEKAFRENPQVAIVTARVIDHRTGATPRKVFPHTNKRLPHDRPHKTFRFQGSGFAIARAAMRNLGPMSDDFFYGLEEIDYAYRAIQAGYEILYEPGVWVVMFEDSGGRIRTRDLEEMRLTNKMIISYKHLPAPYLLPNIVLFATYVTILNRGRINPFRSLAAFLRWRRRNLHKRSPIGRSARDYIRACGGQVWK